MRRKSFEDVPCPIARTMDVLGDHWTPLILREALYGATRFSDFARMLGISRNILSDRLSRMTEHGLLTRVQVDENSHPTYELTPMGHDAIAVLAAMMAWANRWFFEGRPTVILRDTKTGARVEPRVVDQRTGRRFDARRIRIEPGPGFPTAPEALAFRFPSLARSATKDSS